MRRYGKNLWFYPAWPLDLSAHRPALERAGYATFIHMEEHPPKGLEQAKRPGEFNWNVDVL
jgi:putative protease